MPRDDVWCRRVVADQTLLVPDDMTCAICLDDAENAVELKCCGKVLCGSHIAKLRSCPYCRAAPLVSKARDAGRCKLKAESRIRVAVRARPQLSSDSAAAAPIRSHPHCGRCGRGTRSAPLHSVNRPGAAVMTRRPLTRHRDAIDASIDPSGELIRGPVGPGPVLLHLGTVVSVDGEEATVRFFHAVGHGSVDETAVCHLATLRSRCTGTDADSVNHDVRTVVSAGKTAGGKAYTECDVFFGPDSTQDDVYEQFAVDVARRVRAGNSCCLFAYGMTGSGKTHTMMGGAADPGMVPRIAESLFSKPLPPRTVAVMEYFEIYCEKIRDLLVADAPHRKLAVRRTPVGQTYFEEVAKFEVTTYADVINLVAAGNTRRTLASTALNSESSRSHTLLTITFLDRGRGLCTKVHLVDLAGSEPTGQLHTHATLGRWAESKAINMSLLALGRVIHILGSQEAEKGAFVPFRESVLTEFLSDSLGGACRTYVIATVRPEARCSGETSETMRFAHNAMRVCVRNTVSHTTLGEDEMRIMKQLRRVFAHEWVVSSRPSFNQEGPRDSARRSRNQLMTLIRFNPVTWMHLRNGVADAVLPEEEDVLGNIRSRPLPDPGIDLYMRLQLSELEVMRKTIERKSVAEPERLHHLRMKFPFVFGDDAAAAAAAAAQPRPPTHRRSIGGRRNTVSMSA
eukprot:TRINITY_DN46896_c0_g1_i1.p1 TRINITY_DN46896_c0_g1~~TRINITY_DN46896_c0_g1_i1.p1  ORF type:complete len:682 (+),score=159.39 TRINITY_DN46896_c0_g1_i1:61-2106(+)